MINSCGIGGEASDQGVGAILATILFLLVKIDQAKGSPGGKEPVTGERERTYEFE